MFSDMRFVYICVVFFFKQKTAYELRSIDCSSDVCSSERLFASEPSDDVSSGARRHSERRNSIVDQRGSRPVTIIVHHLENSRSQLVLWLLEELDLPYEVRRYERDPKTILAPPALARVHPLGKAPVIVDTDADDRVVAETGAKIGRASCRERVCQAV